MKNKSVEETIESAFDKLVESLEKSSDTPALDAQVVLSHVFARPRSWVMAHPEIPLCGNQPATLKNLITRLNSGEPLPYVLGHWEFFGLDFEISRDVLIPRPETELLVERAIAWLQAHPENNRAADIGTGSGCIATALAYNVPSLRLSATDISLSALEMARRNAVRHGVAERIDFLCLDLFPAEGEYNLIVSNPPYIPSSKLRKLPIFGREPTLALDGGADGLDVIRRLIGQAPERLLPGGLLLMEIEAAKGPAMLSLAFDAFHKADIHLHKDLAGLERILEVQV